MEDAVVKQGWQPSLKLYGGFYAFCLLISLVNFRSAEVASSGRGWDMHMVVGAPWVIGLFLGIFLWLLGRRKQIPAATAGVLLMLLGIMLNFSYEAMEKLTRLIH